MSDGRYAKYEKQGALTVTKYGHTMFTCDVVKDLNRKFGR